MYLQLAENPPISKLVTDNYTFVPGINGDPGVWIRDDKFDDLNDRDHSEILEAVGMSELSSKTKKKAKAERKSAKTDIKKAKADSIRSGTRGQGAKDLFGKVLDTAGSIIGGKTGGSQESPGSADQSGSGADEPKPFYKNPIFIGAGILVLVGGIYFATKKKK